ncbi:MAG: radical SAM protein, partial [Planctomycetes bacterium]|nr:radical SAM protein [Planctomycetota bacterium]
MSADYTRCNLCEHRCAADRTSGPAGHCHASSIPRCFAALTEYAEEDFVNPAFALSLSGCNFRCAFCITGRDSQDAAQGQAADAAKLAKRAREAVAAGARSVFVLGGEPTIFLPWLEEFAKCLRPCAVPLVLKTNLWLTPESLQRCLDAFDVIVADFKFGSDACSKRLGGPAPYVPILERNLRACAARRRTVVRHLVMPGHVDCCTRPVVRWVNAHPGLELSLRDHFVP